MIWLEKHKTINDLEKQNEEKCAPHKTAPQILSEGWKPKPALSYLKMEKAFDVFGALLLIYLLFITCEFILS